MESSGVGPRAEVEVALSEGKLLALMKLLGSFGGSSPMSSLHGCGGVKAHLGAVSAMGFVLRIPLFS